MVVQASGPVEASDPYCLRPGEIDDLLRGASWQRLVIIGDSVAAGISEAVPGYRRMSASDRISEALRVQEPWLRYSNLAERDLVAAEIRERQLGRALELEPDLVVVSAGGNDALRRSFDDARLARELNALVAPLAEHGATVVTIGLFDLARSGLIDARYAEPMAERFDRLDRVTVTVGEEHGALHVDNHHHPLAADASLFAGDRMHANDRGHAVAASNLVRTLATVLPRPAEQPPCRP